MKVSNRINVRSNELISVRKNPFYPVSVELHYMVLTRISGKANNKACMSNSQKQSIQEKCPTTSQMSEHTIRVF